MVKVRRVVLHSIKRRTGSDSQPPSSLVIREKHWLEFHFIGRWIYQQFDIYLENEVLLSSIFDQIVLRRFLPESLLIREATEQTVTLQSVNQPPQPAVARPRLLPFARRITKQIFDLGHLVVETIRPQEILTCKQPPDHEITLSLGEHVVFVNCYEGGQLQRLEVVPATFTTTIRHFAAQISQILSGQEIFAQSEVRRTSRRRFGVSVYPDPPKIAVPLVTKPAVRTSTNQPVESEEQRIIARLRQLAERAQQLRSRGFCAVRRLKIELNLNGELTISDSLEGVKQV